MEDNAKDEEKSLDEKNEEKSIEEKKDAENTEKKEEEKEPEPPPVPKISINEEMIIAGLSQLSRTHDGTSYAYGKLIVEEKEIEEIGLLLPKYKNIKYLSLSKNQIKSVIEVKELPYLLHIDVSKNDLTKLDLLEDPSALQYVQIVNFSSNKVPELSPINLKSLFHLNLNENLITSAIKFKGHERLKILEMRKNKLNNLEGIGNMPLLSELYLAENEITNFSKLSDLPLLKKLHLRKNNIARLREIPTLPSLEYINLRETPLEALKEVKILGNYFGLKALNILATPAYDELGGNTKKELLIIFEEMHIKRINKEDITEEDIKEAMDEKNERKRQEEEARLEAERIAKEKAEEERLEAERIAKEKEEEDKRLEEERLAKEAEAKKNEEDEQAKKESKEQKEPIPKEEDEIQEESP